MEVGILVLLTLIYISYKAITTGDNSLFGIALFIFISFLVWKHDQNACDKGNEAACNRMEERSDYPR